MKTLYAVPWYRCNLNCPHCHVSHREVAENYDKFLYELGRATDYDHVVLFGGEPTLDWDKFLEMIDTGNVDSVSTNLTVYPKEFMEYEFYPRILRNRDLKIATSWNFRRFTPALRDVWFNNVAFLAPILKENFTVMITLTDDLISIEPEFMNFTFGQLEAAGVTQFLFEPYIGDFEVNEKADEWLCRVHDCYPGRMTNLLEEKLKNWNCNCDDVYTLEPDGIIRKGCPDLITSGVMNYCVDCITCEHSDICRPCMLQKTCSYPKKLAKKLGIIK